MAVSVEIGGKGEEEGERVYMGDELSMGVFYLVVMN